MLVNGVDLVEIGRIRELVDKCGETFLPKVYSEREIEYGERCADSAKRLAGGFAVKEAFLKALGVGFINDLGFSLRDIEVLHLRGGRPEVVLRNKAKILFGNKIRSSCVSISYSKEFVVASAVLDLEP